MLKQGFSNWILNLRVLFENFNQLNRLKSIKCLQKFVSIVYIVNQNKIKFYFSVIKFNFCSFIIKNLNN